MRLTTSGFNRQRVRASKLAPQAEEGAHGAKVSGLMERAMAAGLILYAVAVYRMRSMVTSTTGLRQSYVAASRPSGPPMP